MIRSAAFAVFGLACVVGTARSQPAPLVIEAKIPLGAVAGRIDHMAVDLGRGRLFVAELGNNSLGVVDIARRVVLRTINGLNEPQGVGYLTADDTVFVANGSDGSVQRFAGADLTPMPPICSSMPSVRESMPRAATASSTSTISAVRAWNASVK